MATRGAIGVGTPSKWRAVYNHWDNYPEGIAHEIWQKIKKMGVVEFAEKLMQFDDWRAFMNDGICEYCGKETGQPHTISGAAISSVKCPSGHDFTNNIGSKDGKQLRICYKCNTEFTTAFPDPEAKHHKHNDISNGRAEKQLDQDSADALFIEWVYVIDPDKKLLHVLTNARSSGSTKVKGYQGREFDRPNYTHSLVGSYDLDGDEPNWTDVQQKGLQIGEEAYEKYGEKATV